MKSDRISFLTISPLSGKAGYGWSYSYWGSNVDTVRPENLQKVASAIAPGYSFGSQVGALGLVFQSKRWERTSSMGCSSKSMAVGTVVCPLATR